MPRPRRLPGRGRDSAPGRRRVHPAAGGSSRAAARGRGPARGDPRHGVRDPAVRAREPIGDRRAVRRIPARRARRDARDRPQRAHRAHHRVGHRGGARRAAPRFAKAIDGMLAPVVAAVAVVPIVALAPVLYTMFGSTSEVARILIASLAVFVPVFLNTLRGLRQVRPVHRDLLRAYAATRWQADARDHHPVRRAPLLHRPAHRRLPRGDLGARRRVLRRSSRGPRFGDHDRGVIERVRAGVGVRDRRHPARADRLHRHHPAREDRLPAPLTTRRPRSDARPAASGHRPVGECTTRTTPPREEECR